MLTPSQTALNHPGLFFAKSCGCESSKKSGPRFTKLTITVFSYSRVFHWKSDSQRKTKIEKFQPLPLISTMYTLAMSQVPSKEIMKTTMVTKNWTSKVGLSRFSNNPQEAFLLTTFKKKYVMIIAILSKVD
jgi:hypothetical protein